MKQHNASTIDVLEDRLSAHNHKTLGVAAKIQANLYDLESYLIQIEKNKTNGGFASASSSVDSDQGVARKYRGPCRTQCRRQAQTLRRVGRGSACHCRH